MKPDSDVVRAVKTEREAIAKFIESMASANPDLSWRVTNSILKALASAIRKGDHHDE